MIFLESNFIKIEINKLISITTSTIILEIPAKSNLDRITKIDLGKVWYSNIDKRLEFFTDSWAHSAD